MTSPRIVTDKSWRQTHAHGFRPDSEPFDVAGCRVVTLYVRRLESVPTDTDERLWRVTTSPCQFCSKAHTLYVGSADHDPVLGRYTAPCRYQVVLAWSGGLDARAALVRQPVSEAQRQARRRAAARDRQRRQRADAVLAEEAARTDADREAERRAVEAEAEAKAAVILAEGERERAEAEADYERRVEAAKQRRARKRDTALKRRRRRPKPPPDHWAHA